METLALKDNTSNPAPLGLLGFGLTTVLLNLHNSGFIEMSSMILAMGIFYGGIPQIIAGIMEWKKKNTFGSIAFTSYGFFWLSLVAILTMPKLGLAATPSKESMACYLLMWGLFTFAMFIATLKKNRISQLVFGSLTVLFVLLALGDITENSTIKIIAGYEGIICGFFAIYDGSAQILNETYGKVILPLGNKK